MRFHWRKVGKVFDPTQVKGRSWIKEFAQAPSSLVFDEFIRVYFSCRPPPDANGQYVSFSAYVDLDRTDPTRVLRVSEHPILTPGSLGAFDEFGTYPVSVIRAGAETRAYYGGWTRCESVPFNVAIGLATSEDGGRTFSKAGPGPVLSYSPDEPFVLSGPKIRRFGETWFLYYIAGKRWILANEKPEPVYKIRMATSRDGLRWSKLNRDLIPDRLGEDEAQASPDVFEYDGQYHMFFCYRRGTDYRHNHERSYRIGYASSPDLIEWKRDDDAAGIDVSAAGWDSEMVAYPHVAQDRGKLWLFYLGNQVGREGFGAAWMEAKTP
jgi:predicted GH43/DUF377 family glycosyl hydrolase